MGLSDDRLRWPIGEYVGTSPRRCGYLRATFGSAQLWITDALARGVRILGAPRSVRCILALNNTAQTSRPARALLLCLLTSTVIAACGAPTINKDRTSQSAPYIPGGIVIRSAVKATGQHLTEHLTYDGLVRTYELYVPASLPRHPAPLLVALHGGLGSGLQFETNTDFDGLAEANKFLVVYPDGTPTGLGPNRLVWNAGGCCGSARAGQENIDDVGFVSRLIVLLEHDYDVNPHQVFVTGHSNGAMLAYVVACDDASHVAAVAVQAGALLEPTCHPSLPVATMEIHGTDDQNVPIDGGKGSRDISGTVYPPPVKALETFASADGCSARRTSADPTNRAVTIELWKNCRRSTSVEWIKVAGANHAWMGHPASPGAELLLGKPFSGFDSSQAVWSFLAAHPRAQ